MEHGGLSFVLCVSPLRFVFLACLCLLPVGLLLSFSLLPANEQQAHTDRRSLLVVASCFLCCLISLLALDMSRRGFSVVLVASSDHFFQKIPRLFLFFKWGYQQHERKNIFSKQKTEHKTSRRCLDFKVVKDVCFQDRTTASSLEQPSESNKTA